MQAIKPVSIWMTLLAASTLAFPATAQPDDPSIKFQYSDIGATTDPTGLLTDQELAEGGSTVQPPIWYSTFDVNEGTVTLAILVDAWCSVSECPFRLRLETADGVARSSHDENGYGMICQDTESMTVNRTEMTIHACTDKINLTRPPSASFATGED